MTEKKLEVCTMCNGKGEYEDSYDDMFGNNTSFMASCDICEGIGMTEPVDENRVNEILKDFLQDI